MCKRGKKQISDCGATTNSEVEGQISQKIIVSSESDGFHLEGCSIDSSGFELSCGEANHEVYWPANASFDADAGIEVHDTFLEDVAGNFRASFCLGEIFALNSDQFYLWYLLTPFFACSVHFHIQ